MSQPKSNANHRNVIGLLCWVALVVLAAQVAARGQESGTILGQVLDARTGLGLAKVMVVVEGTGPAAQTGDDGAFELAGVAPGARQLSVSTVGYIFVRREVTVTPGGTTRITIPLSEGTGTYTEAVTVTADRFRPVEPAVAAQQVLGSADLQNLRGVLADDPLRAVQVLPGVTTGDDLRSEFSVRGSSFNRMNMTVDGFSTPYLVHTVRAVEDYSGSGSVAMINSDILEDVTLLNGGYAQRFGNRTGAELDFRLREGSRERRQARAAVSGTSASLVFEGPLGSTRRGSWLVSARQSYLDLIIEHLIDEGIHFTFTDAQAKLVFDATPRQRFELALIAGRSRLRQVREDADADYLEAARNASGVAIGSWRVVVPRGVITTRVLSAVNTFTNDASSEANLDRGRDAQVAGRTDVLLNVGRGLDVEGGVQADWIDQSRTRRRASAGTYRVVNDYRGDGVRSGGYAQLRWARGPLTLVPGARADRWSLTGQRTVSPWIQGEVKVTSSMALRGGAGIYRQFPDFEQVIGSLGHPDAVAERATQYDLGIEQRLTDDTRWQVTVYDRQEDGFFRRLGTEARLVNGRVVRGSSSAAYGATLEGYARGVEVLVQRKSPNGLAGWVAYSYGRNRYHDRLTGESFWGDLDQRHTLNLYLFYRKSDRVSVSGKLRAGSNVPAPGYYAERDGGFFVSDVRNRERLPVYSRIDLRGNRTYAWGRRRLTIFAEVMNILNRDNVRFNPPGINTRTGRVSNPFERMIPIVPSLGMLIEF
jgi:hypothetical protein